MTDESGSVLNGLPLVPLPEGWVATGVAALIKCTDSDGTETWAFRTSGHLSDEETLGALIVRTEIAKKALIEDYTILDDESDGGD